jgi:putative glycosyltransferase
VKLSIVSTMYHSGLHIAEFAQRTAIAANKHAGDDYEIILVNDGSPDRSLDLALDIAKADTHVVVVDLSRNFGHHKAMMTGLSHTRGEQVFLIDCDLEEEPEWLAPFAQQMREQRCDVVYGVQERRKGGFFEQWSGRLFYHLFRMLSGLDLPDNVVVARLMSRRYVDALVRHREYEVFMAGLWVITGFEQNSQLVRKHHTSRSTYTLRRKMAQLVNSITAFSVAPLRMIFALGCGIFLLASLYSTYLVTNWLFLARPPGGYTSVMVSVWLLGGMIIAFIGVIGIYLSKIYSETKRRPYTIVRGVFAKGAWTNSERE